LGTEPCVPMLIIFHLNPMGMEPILSEISPLNTSTSIVDVENKSHPNETGFSDWRDDFHNPNFVFLSHVAVAFMTLGKGSRNPRSAEV